MWVNIVERLPPRKNNTTEIVDLWVDGERWPNCYYCFDDELWYDTDCHATIDGATHWMPLPESPKD